MNQADSISFPEEIRNIFEAISILNLPLGPDNFIQEETGTYSFYDDLYTLKWALQDVIHKKANLPTIEMYYTNVFLAIVYYFLIENDRKHAAYCLEKVDSIFKTDYTNVIESAKQKKIKKLLINLKYRIKPISKMGILVDKDYGEKYQFRSIQKSFSGFTDIIFLPALNAESLIDYLNRYDQIMLVGHGNEKGTTISNFEISPDWLIGELKSKSKPIGVLGIFSCQENWSSTDVKDYVDYFITDSISSNQQYNEMFLFSFIQNYLESKRIVDSFNIASLAPVFRASSDVRFELFESGFKASNYWDLA